jgi:signal transduction histidine kinase
MKKICLGYTYFLFLCFSVSAQDRINNGILDLRNHDWQKNSIVNLNGNWEFYWHHFYSPYFFADSSRRYEKHYALVPNFWNDYTDGHINLPQGFGYGTYHLTVLCPFSQQQLALKFLTIESAYTLYVNGKKVLEIGHPDTSAATTVAALQPAIVNVIPENNKLDIVIQVANFHNKVGGLWDLVKLGTSEQIHSKLIVNISLELLVAGSLLISSIYYFILFVYFKKRYVLFYFSVVCMAMCIRSLVTGEMPILFISHFNWLFARRMEYISLYLSLPAVSLFSYHLFPQDFSRKVLYIILPVSAVFLTLSLFFPYYIFTYPVRYFEIIILITAMYGLFVYIKAAMNKRPGSLLFLIAFCIFIITIINDTLYANLIIRTVPLFYVGLMVFVISLSILLSKQFSKALSELHVANTKLSDANKILESMNNEIKEKNVELKKINHEMDSLVNRTSHDLRAPLNSVLNLIKVSEDETNIDKMREYVSIEEKTLTRMNNLINDIIDFSKNKRLKLDLREIDFEKIVNDALEDHSFMSNAQPIKKMVEIRQYEKFISDPRRVNMIINNLISNAIKYADLAKEQPCIRIKISVVDGMATIQVEDNGVGIEQPNLDKIFTLFYRATSSSTGSGLGLYIVKEAVEKLSGYINISSNKGEGTTIKINIPDMGYTL